jgi:hypothetical protein
MAKRVRKITPAFLKRVIKEEARKLRLETSDPIEAGVEDPAKVAAEETDADELAGSLAKDLDHIKALKIHERRLVKKIKQIREAKQKLANRIAKRV